MPPYIFVFVFGAIIGSFLNVVIIRYKDGNFSGRSKCVKCQTPLLWFELIPILSFFSSGGRCRHCGAPISWQYPIIETLVGLIFVLVFWKYSFLLVSGFDILLALVFFSLLVVIATHDFYSQEIPNLVYGVLALSFLSLLMNFSWSGLLAGPLLALPFSLLFFGSKGRLIGFGDAKIILAIGWFLGLQGGLVAVLLSFWIGAVVSLILLLSKGQKFTMKSTVPFAPMIVLATLLVFVFNLNFEWLIKIFTI